ncbi:MAG: hypothetical protein LUG87_03425, partial [Oscillospiraceae bacterium]|nr:hypothetical protein [Oscillospiraceae bacterium]
VWLRSASAAAWVSPPSGKSADFFQAAPHKTAGGAGGKFRVRKRRKSAGTGAPRGQYPVYFKLLQRSPDRKQPSAAADAFVRCRLNNGAGSACPAQFKFEQFGGFQEKCQNLFLSRKRPS